MSIPNSNEFQSYQPLSSEEVDKLKKQPDFAKKFGQSKGAVKAWYGLKVTITPEGEVSVRKTLKTQGVSKARFALSDKESHVKEKETDHITFSPSVQGAAFRRAKMGNHLLYELKDKIRTIMDSAHDISKKKEELDTLLSNVDDTNRYTDEAYEKKSVWNPKGSLCLRIIEPGEDDALTFFDTKWITTPKRFDKLIDTLQHRISTISEYEHYRNLNFDNLKNQSTNSPWFAKSAVDNLEKNIASVPAHNNTLVLYNKSSEKLEDWTAYYNGYYNKEELNNLRNEKPKYMENSNLLFTKTYIQKVSNWAQRVDTFCQNAHEAYKESKAAEAAKVQAQNAAEAVKVKTEKAAKGAKTKTNEAIKTTGAMRQLGLKPAELDQLTQQKLESAFNEKIRILSSGSSSVEKVQDLVKATETIKNYKKW